MSNPFGLKPYSSAEEFIKTITWFDEIVHPYAKEIGTPKYNYVWEWIRFKYEYDYIRKVVNTSGLREMLEQVKR